MLDELHNSGPGHEADFISYMYGEMDTASRDLFESHLATCDSCAVELGAYADARLGVIEWRRNDFEPLATPAIIIPESQPVATLVNERPKRIWAGWLETIYSLPRLAQAGMGLAAATLLFGIFYFAITTRRAGNEPQNIAGKSQVTPAAQSNKVAPPTPATPDVASVNKGSETSPAPVEIKDHRPAGIKPADRPQRAAIRQSPVMRNYRKLGSLEAVTVTPNTKAAPTLNTFEEEEDTTLRLSDLFSQVSPRKK